ncbi:hypothetical protein HPB51_019507 [Rhipicephalus microplus]|uniref:Tick transposon n=1 Tax=Rhipicephalus microplus TaxID=6941 RepID=A0A9J6EBC1_RHIMP|nr:hypothetical protein HPB51_019507 [Rhipicephalus microplus]
MPVCCWKFQVKLSASSQAILFVPSGSQHWPSRFSWVVEELLRLTRQFVLADAIVHPADRLRKLFRLGTQQPYRELTREHPDARLVAGRHPLLMPATGFTRPEQGIPVDPRIGFVWPAEQKHRLRGTSSPNWPDGGVVETLSHLLCEYPAFGEARKQPVKRYRLVGLPCATLQGLLHPSGCTKTIAALPLRPYWVFLRTRA